MLMAKVVKDMKRIKKWGSVYNVLWKVNALQAAFHKDGNAFQTLKHFPGAFFDKHGYLLFKTKEEYEKHPFLSIGLRTHIRGGRNISNLPGYVRVNSRTSC